MLLAFLIATLASFSFTALANSPPPPNDAALMARYIVNQANWTSLGTLSAQKNIKGYPFVTLISLSDGPLDRGSGVPYILLTEFDVAYKNFESDNRASMMMSLAQGEFCHEKNYDPMDPRCARVMLTGRLKKISMKEPEYKAAETAINHRHEWLVTNSPRSHIFHYVKLEIETITVFAKFGRPVNVPVYKYFDIESNEIEQEAQLYK